MLKFIPCALLLLISVAAFPVSSFTCCRSLPLSSCVNIRNTMFMSDNATSILDDKKRLLEIVSTTGMGKEESKAGAQEVDSIINKLEKTGKGFIEATVDGEWQLVFSRNSKGSPSLQKVFSFQKGFANFDVKEKVFHNIVELFGNKIQVLADVAYVAEQNRLISTITMAGIKLGRLFIPLPFKGRKGYLDMLYLDEDVRISKGNRGGVFVHVRPTSLLAKRS